MLYNINLQFPNHYFVGQTQVNEDCLESDYHMRTFVAAATKDLVTTFHDSGIEIENSPLRPIYNMLAEFYDFGAKYFREGNLSGEDVAAKLTHQLGEIYLGNPQKSTYNYHFSGVWPHSVNFGELCYSSDPSFDLEITWKYKKCDLCNQLTAPML